MILLDIRKTIFSKKTIIFVSLGFLLLLYFGLDTENYYRQIQNLENSDTNGFFLFQSSLHLSSLYFVFLAALSSFIYSPTYLKDKNSKVGYSIITREGYNMYFLRKIIVTATTAFIIELFTLLLFLMYCLVKYKFPTINYLQLGSNEVFYTNPSFWAFSNIIIFSIYFSILSLTSLGISSYIKKYYLIYPSILIYILLLVITISTFNLLTNRMFFEFLHYIFPLTPLSSIYYDFSFQNIFSLILSIIFYLAIAIYLLHRLYTKDKEIYI